MPDVSDIDLFATSAYKVLNDYFDITLYRSIENRVFFWGNPLLHQRGWKRELNRRLAAIRAKATIDRDQDRYRLTVVRMPVSVGAPPLTNLLLFVLTFLTVLIAASFREVGTAVFSEPSFLIKGMPFTLTLLTILLIHEMGHFIAGHRRGVIMSYPYFIPAPTFLGTFGALIRSRSPILNRNDLILVGAAGPLAGAIPAVLALILGHSTSTLVPIGAEPVLWGDSLLTWATRMIFFGPIPQGMALHRSSIALAGHIGLLVTMINLLPLGQLDGGHIIHGLLGRRQRALAIVFLCSLLVLGFFWAGWWLWLVIAILMRPFHPPVVDQGVMPDSFHRKMGWIAVITFIVTFVPRPIY